MIKFVQCIRRKPALSVAEFRKFFWDDYTGIVQRLAETVKAIRCSEMISLEVPENLEIMLARGTGEAFDAMVEISMESTASLGELAGSAEFQELMTEFRSFQEKFIDLENSTFFFASEDLLIEP